MEINFLNQFRQDIEQDRRMKDYLKSMRNSHYQEIAQLKDTYK